MNDRVRTALGFAMKAGRISSGELAAEKAVRSGKAFAAALDSGASEQTRERWSRLCSGAGVPLIIAEDVGGAIGREAHMIACVTEKGFADMLIRADMLVRAGKDNEL